MRHDADKPNEGSDRGKQGDGNDLNCSGAL